MQSADSNSDRSHSVTRFIEQLKEDDSQAAGQIWQRYFERLLPLARSKIGSLPHRIVDEEDILVSVFDRFFRATKEGRFARLQNRDDLWQILLMLTERKVADQYRHDGAQKRGGETAPESNPGAADVSEFADEDPGPEFVAAFNDSLTRAITRLDGDTTREVALLRMEGYELKEIADRLEISVSSVERKMRVIREVWQEEFGE